MRNLLLASVLVLIVASPMWGQEPSAVARLVMAREGGPVPIGESAVFYSTDAKAVAWVQFASPAHVQTVVFRWLDPDGKLQRSSSSRTPAEGAETAWDELLIRGHSPARLTGRWTIELYGDGRLLSATRFRILRNGPSPSPAAWLREGRLPVISLSGQQSPGDALNVSRVFGYDVWPGLSTQVGIEASRTPNALEVPPRQTETGTVFFNVRYTPAQWSSIAFSLRHEREVDDHAHHITDSATTTWMLSSSYFKGRFSFSGTYSMQEADDRTLADADVLNRALILTASYSLTPRLALSVTRSSLAQGFKATPLSLAFTQRLDTTMGRLTYQPLPNLSLALMTLDTTVARSDTQVTSSLSQRGLEVAYRLNPRLSFTVLTKWQEQRILSAGVASRSDQRMSSFGVNFFPAQDLTLGLTYSPQVIAAASGATRADVWTASISYTPSSRLFFAGTYALARTTGVGVEAINKSWAISLRYAPTPWAEIQTMVRVNDAQFPLFPITDTSTTTFQIATSWRF